VFNVCHMSDFEIFELAPQKEAGGKTMKPPKKHTFAIKSMQKSNMFLGDTGYIHFFSVNDAKVGQEFHSAVFSWRAWYLINVMGESTDPAKASNPATLQTSSLGLATHKRNASQGSKYMLGSFDTGIDFDATTFEVALDTGPRRHMRNPSDTPLASAFQAPVNSSGVPSAIEHSKAIYDRKMSMRTRGTNPPPALHNKIHARNISVASGYGTSSNATPTSASFRDQSTATTSPASGAVRRSSSVRSTANRNSNGPQLSRSDSRSNPSRPPIDFGRPLIDLTPQYHEPPQHSRKGKGFKPATLPPGGLIAAVTGPDLAPGAVAIPEARDWRPRGASISQHQNGSGSNVASGPARTRGPSASSGSGLQRNSSLRSARGSGARGLVGDLNLDEGFTGGGLLGGHTAKASVSGDPGRAGLVK
jgi:hypothetical protein